MLTSVIDYNYSWHPRQRKRGRPGYIIEMSVNQCDKLASETTEEREARLQEREARLQEREARLQEMCDRLASKTTEEREARLEQMMLCIYTITETTFQYVISCG